METSLEKGLLSFLAEVPDPRSRHGRRHSLSAILALVCCAVMSGAKSYAAIGQWAYDQEISRIHQPGFTRRPPKSGGIRKVLIALNITAFEAALTRWAEAKLGRPIAEADQTLRRSHSMARRREEALTAFKRECICSRSWPTSRG